MKISVCLLTLSGLMLLSCTSIDESYSPNGNTSYKISCPLKSLNSCYQKAGEICKSKGYVIISETGGDLPSIIAECKK